MSPLGRRRGPALRGKGMLYMFWVRLGIVLEPAWGHLGPSWAILGDLRRSYSEIADIVESMIFLLENHTFGAVSPPKMGQVGLKMASEGVLGRLVLMMSCRSRLVNLEERKRKIREASPDRESVREAGPGGGGLEAKASREDIKSHTPLPFVGRFRFASRCSGPRREKVRAKRSESFVCCACLRERVQKQACNMNMDVQGTAQ